MILCLILWRVSFHYAHTSSIIANTNVPTGFLQNTIQHKEKPYDGWSHLKISFRYVGICCPDNFRGPIEKWNWNSNQALQICNGEQQVSSVSQLVQQFARVVDTVQPRSLNKTESEVRMQLAPPVFEPKGRIRSCYLPVSPKVQNSRCRIGTTHL